MDQGLKVESSKIVVCSTGLSSEEIDAAKRIVDQLGMRWDDDLHDEVTHLLAMVVGSAKYKAAKAMKMKIVKLEWLDACLQQNDIVESSPYELGPLEGLCICTTGLYVEDREKIQELCDSAGAIYHPDLNFGTTTHLIAEQPEGAKYNTAIAYGIPVVSVDWIAACIDSNEYKDEDPYRLKEEDRPTENNECLKLSDELSQCLGMLGDEPPGSFFDGCVFWLNGFPQDIVLKMKRLLRFGMGTRYDTYNITVTHIIADFLGNSQHYRETNGALEIVSAKWLIDSCLASECMNEALYPPPQTKTDYSIPKKLQVALENRASLAEKIQPPLLTHSKSNEDTKLKMFSGYTFLLLFTDKLGSLGNLSLKEQVKHAGGRYREINTIDPRILQPNDLKRITHIILGHGCELPDGMLPSLSDSIPNAKLSTELWLHCCLQDHRIYPRRKHPLFCCSADVHASVFPQLPIPCFQNLTVCISMFVDVERAVLSCLLRLSGAKLTLKLSKRNTHLVCRIPEGPKYEKALEWKVAVVDAKWLTTSISAATLLECPEFSRQNNSMKRKFDEGQIELLSIVPKQNHDELVPELNASQEQPCSQDSIHGGAMTQLDNILNDMGGSESCSIDNQIYLPTRRPPLEHRKDEINPNYFDNSQESEKNSDYVLYADGTEPIFNR